MPAGPRVVVAGAGVLGSLCALLLARAGARVTWLDPCLDQDGRTTPNASAVAAGMLAPACEALFDPVSPPFDLMRQARDLWPTLAASVGIALERQGALAVGSEADVETWADRLATLDVPFDALAPARVRETAPWLGAPGHGVLTGEDWRLSALAALAVLRDAVQKEGAIIDSLAVTGWASGEVILSAERLPFDAMVVATGASDALATSIPELARLTPIKGHILRAPQAALSGPMVRAGGLYVCPDGAGALVGATMEPGLDDAAVDPAVAQALTERFATIAPSIPTGSFQPMAGVRAATPDCLPMAGPSATSGVWLASGARRNGWLLAPLIADIVTRGVLGQAPPPWAALMAPSRFAQAN